MENNNEKNWDDLYLSISDICNEVQQFSLDESSSKSVVAKAEMDAFTVYDRIASHKFVYGSDIFNDHNVYINSDVLLTKLATAISGKVDFDDNHYIANASINDGLYATTFKDEFNRLIRENKLRTHIADIDLEPDGIIKVYLDLNLKSL